MNFPFYIARRYLFSKKSTHAINVISGISMVFLPAMTNYVVLDMLYNSTYIMGSLIGSYFAAFNWHGGSMIALVLLGIICVFTLVTNGKEDTEARTGGALL
jgi:spermidine/putrescine transport system permease protein